MVKLVVITWLSLASWTWANHSGLYSHKAQQAFNQGDYRSAEHSLKKALRHSKREANSNAEAGIYIALSNIYLHQYHFAQADTLLNHPQLAEMQPQTQLAWLLAKLRLYNQQQKYSATQTVFTQYSNLTTHKKLSSTQRAFCWLEYAVAQTALGQNSDASLQEASKLLKKQAQGQVQWTRARILYQQGNYSAALDAYQTAFNHAQSARKYWETAQILTQTSAVYDALGQRENAISSLFKAVNVFEQLDLSIPYVLSAEKWKSLSGKNDLDYKIEVFRKRHLTPP